MYQIVEVAYRSAQQQSFSIASSAPRRMLVLSGAGVPSRPLGDRHHAHPHATPPGRLHPRRRAGHRGHLRAKRRGHRQHRRRAIAPGDQPQRLRRGVRDAGAAGRSQRAAEPVRRQQHHALQLADQRRQSRAGLVLPEHPGSQRHRRQARRRLHHRCQERAARSRHSPFPTIGWVARLGANRAKLASYSIAKYGPQTGNDCAVVSRCRQRHPRQRRRQDHLERSGRCQHAEQRDDAARLDQPPRHALGRGRQRRAEILHPRQRARPSGTRRIATCTRPAPRWRKCATTCSPTRAR